MPLNAFSDATLAGWIICRRAVWGKWDVQDEVGILTYTVPIFSHVPSLEDERAAILMWLICDDATCYVITNAAGPRNCDVNGCLAVGCSW